MNLLRKLLTSATAYGTRPSLTVPAPPMGRFERVPPREVYQVMRAYYHNNNLYDTLAQVLRDEGIWSESRKPLRNPANRVVEFYAAKLWAGPLGTALKSDDRQGTTPAFTILADNQAIVPAIQQVWDWSNWGAKKQVAARWFAMLGDMFLKVAATEDGQRVYFQLLEPETVTDFDVDERGYVTYLRMDIAQIRRRGDRTEGYTHTEVWDRAQGTYRVWEHDRGADEPVEQLGVPTVNRDLAEFGIDFVPIVWAPFRDIGDDRGANAFVHALDKIDEANRSATRLHQLLFRNNDAHWAIQANATDPNGRPLPAPRIGSSDGTQDSDTVTIGADRLLRLPGNATLTPLVPNLHYAEALEILNAHIAECERDLPEMAYSRLRDMGTLSGRAVRSLLGDAVDRVVEARGNGEAAIIRANQMALTIGAHLGLFTAIGTYEAGDFAHVFAERSVIAIDELEQAQADQARAQVWTLKAGIGISDPQLQREAGYTDDQITQMAGEKAVTQATLGAAMLDAFSRGQQQGV